MDLTDTNLIIVVAIVALIVIGLISAALARRWRTERLQEKFGPEYDRTLQEIGDQRQAESELEKRIAHVKDLQIRPLTAEEVNRYALEWQATQREFVDEPFTAVKKADRLIREVMEAKGYTVDDFNQLTADISVDHAELVTDYRGMHQIAVKESSDEVSTEDLRQAMVHGRALFENLIQQKSKEDRIDQKEKI